MPIWKTGVVTSPGTTAISALLLFVSCGPAEQGYWTKEGISQALTDEQYAADSPHCERFAAQNDGRESDKARKKRYTKCMSARDYQWVVKEKPVSLPEQSGQSTHPPSCPAGSTNCIPGGTKGGGLNPEVNQSITREESSHHNPANLPPDPSHQSNEQRLVKDWECRQQADATLSSPYAVYVNCMQEKRRSSPPAIRATADSAENEKPDPSKGHAQEDIGLQTAARNIGEETPNIGSATGNMSRADSAENEKPETNPALERIGLGVQSAAGNIGSGISKIGSAIGRPVEAIGRGLQSVFRNIGDEVSKIGSRIGNMFKQLGGKDTRDKDKDKASNKLVAAPPER